MMGIGAALAKRTKQYVATFNGSSSEIIIPSVTYAGDFDISLDFNPAVTGNALIMLGEGATASNMISLLNTDVIRLRVGGYTYDSAVQSITVDTWYNVNVVRSGTTLTLDLDGVEIINVTESSAGTFDVIGTYGSGLNFNGSIKNVNLNGERHYHLNDTSKESSNLIPYPNDLADAWWYIDKCSVVTDAVTAPTTTGFADAIVSNTTNATHSVFDNSKGIIDPTKKYRIRWKAKAGGKNFIRVTAAAWNASWGSLGIVNAFVDLTTLDTANASNLDMQALEVSATDIGSGWVQCEFLYTTGSLVGLTSERTFQISPAISLADSNYLGDGTTEEIYVGDIEVKQIDIIEDKIGSADGHSTDITWSLE